MRSGGSVNCGGRAGERERGRERKGKGSNTSNELGKTLKEKRVSVVPRGHDEWMWPVELGFKASVTQRRGEEGRRGGLLEDVSCPSPATLQKRMPGDPYMLGTFTTGSSSSIRATFEHFRDRQREQRFHCWLHSFESTAERRK